MLKRPLDFIRAFGITLIVLGVLALLAQVFRLNIGALIWPFFIILPGMLLFFFSIALEGGLGEAIAMVSGMVTVAGVLLLYQSLTGHWTSWAYAWALVAPAGTGAALVVYGGLRNRPSSVKSGRSFVEIGLALFIAGLIFFELILNISGVGLGFVGWPVLFIGLGIYILLKGVLRRRQ